jgi:uncharacterized protein YuzE
VADRADVYVRFTDLPVDRSQRIGMGEEDVHVDFDVAGRPVGIEILAAYSVEIDGAPVEVDRG